jgi:hypothetical protein
VGSVAPEAVVNKLDGVEPRDDTDVMVRPERLDLCRERLGAVEKYEQLDDEVPQLVAVHVEEDTGADGSGYLDGYGDAVI